MRRMNIPPIAQRIKELLGEREPEWTQSDLAKKSKVPNGVLSRILTGKRRPDPETLVKVASALKQSPLEFFRLAYLPTLPQTNAEWERAKTLFMSLSKERQARMIQQMIFESEMQEQEKRRK